MRVVSRLFRLAVRWNPRDRDSCAEITPRYGNSDIHYIFSVLGREFFKEMDSRGYDLSTLRFYIDKKQSAIDEHFRIYPESPYREAYEKQSGRTIKPKEAA